jgi:DNA-binding MarR family transcriptional regulator
MWRNGVYDGISPSPLNSLGPSLPRREGNHAPANLTLDEQIIVAIRQISQAIENYSRFLSFEHGITSPQLAVLRELQRQPKLTPGQLSERLHISPQTVAGIVKRLEQRGLISRARDTEDRRSFCLELTREGKNLCEAAPSLMRDQFRAELERLEPWERTQILASMQRVAQMMNTEEADSVPFFFHEALDSRS